MLLVVGDIARKLGVVRAGQSAARELLADGANVLVYPGGDVDALRAYRDRHKIMFDGRKRGSPDRREVCDLSDGTGGCRGHYRTYNLRAAALEHMLHRWRRFDSFTCHGKYAEGPGLMTGPFWVRS
ncbi:hypothetical protein [Nocardioides montaniterrae]